MPSGTSRCTWSPLGCDQGERLTGVDSGQRKAVPQEPREPGLRHVRRTAHVLESFCHRGHIRERLVHIENQDCRTLGAILTHGVIHTLKPEWTCVLDMGPTVASVLASKRGPRTLDGAGWRPLDRGLQFAPTTNAAEPVQGLSPGRRHDHHEPSQALRSLEQRPRAAAANENAGSGPES
jgi:hypothetical protein